jgi:tripartite ATP-independent transporter DctM subunit
VEALDIVILIISFVIFLSLGIPVAYSLGLSAVLTLLIGAHPMAAFTALAQRMATGLDSFTLLAIPFFILAGQLMNKGGIAIRLIDFAKVLVGRLPGGLAFVNIVANMLFGSISGSAGASASAIGGFMTPVMEKEGYARPFSAAVNITSATTGLVIPPSNILIVYSLASGGVSIAALFIAGYLPGLLIGLSLMIVAAYHSRHFKTPATEKVSVKYALIKFLDALPSIFLLVIVIGGIIAGIFTATEASVIAVVYTLILAFIYKELKPSDLPEVLLGTVKTVAIVMLLIATSIALSWVLSFENVPQDISSALLNLSDNKFILLLIINSILLIVGIFMDMTPAVLIFTPIFLPVMLQFGVNPIHFGIVMIVNLCVGLCTPPVGAVLFIGCSVADVTIEQVIKPLLPFFVAMITALLLITYIPEISLWLPRLFGL